MISKPDSYPRHESFIVASYKFFVGLSLTFFSIFVSAITAGLLALYQQFVEWRSANRLTPAPLEAVSEKAQKEWKAGEEQLPVRIISGGGSYLDEAVMLLARAPALTNLFRSGVWRTRLSTDVNQARVPCEFARVLLRHFTEGGAVPAQRLAAALAAAHASGTGRNADPSKVLARLLYSLESGLDNGAGLNPLRALFRVGETVEFECNICGKKGDVAESSDFLSLPIPARIRRKFIFSPMDKAKPRSPFEIDSPKDETLERLISIILPRISGCEREHIVLVATEKGSKVSQLAPLAKPLTPVDRLKNNAGLNLVQAFDSALFANVLEVDSSAAWDNCKDRAPFEVNLKLGSSVPTTSAIYLPENVTGAQLLQLLAGSLRVPRDMLKVRVETREVEDVDDPIQLEQGDVITVESSIEAAVHEPSEPQVITTSISLEQLIESREAPKLAAQGEWHCSCGNSSALTRQIHVKNAPQILVVDFDRVSRVRGTWGSRLVKNPEKIDFPVSQPLVLASAKTPYELVGIVNQLGEPGQRQASALVKSFGQWFEARGEQLHRVNESDVVTGDATLLMFIKKNN